MKMHASDATAGLAMLALMLPGCDAAAIEPLDPWPFTVDRVTLSCNARRVFVMTDSGVRYAVNGSAGGEAPMTDPIQSHYDTRAVIDRGLKLCDDGDSKVVLKRPAASAVQAIAPGDVKVEAGEVFGGLSLDVTTAEPINGKRPKIAATCDEEGDPSLFLDLVRAPPRPPRLRGNFMTIRFDNRTPIRVEAAWFPDTSWTPREATPASERLLALGLATAKSVTVDGLQPFAPGPITWTVNLAASERARFARACRGR